MHRVIARLAGAAVAALVVCLSAAAPSGSAVAFAQSTDPSVQVELNDAQVEFGCGIRFRLRARSADSIRSVLLLYQVDDSAVQNTGVPAYQPGPTVNAAYSWRVAGVLAPGSQVRYQWQIEAAGGKTTTTEQAIVYNDTRFNWREAQSDRITVYWHSAEQQTGATLLDEATKVQAKLSREYGLGFDRPVRIFAYSRPQDYASALSSGRSLDVALTVGLDRIFVLAPGGTSGSGMTTALQGLRREVANAVFLQKTANPYADPPRWLSEGFGLLMGGEEISAENAQALSRIAQANRLLPLKTLSGNFPNGDQERGLAYAESISVVKYMFDTYGAEKMRAVFSAFKEGNTADDALKRGLGVTLDQLEGRWKTALKNGTANRPSGASRQPSDAAPADGVADRMFGPTIRFWQGVFGPYGQMVTIGMAGFIGLAVVAIVGGTAFSLWRRNREDED